MTTATRDAIELCALTLTVGDWLLIDRTEQKLGIWIGENRHRVDLARGCVPRIEQEEDKILSNDRAGAMAEVAVARRLNLFPKIDIDHYWSFDLRLPSGDPFAVTFSGRIECLLDKRRDAQHIAARKELPEFYVAVTGSAPYFEFAGWATREEVLAADEDDRGYGPCYALTTLRPTLEVFTLPKRAGYR